MYFNTNVNKQAMQQHGVYCIVNLRNNKKYIGSCCGSFQERSGEHYRSLIRNSHSNRRLQNSWNKYGPDSFTFVILESVVDSSRVIEREQYFINKEDKKMLFNICLIAGNTLGVKCSQSRRRKVSKRWVMVSPQKEIFRTRNMAAFCRDHHLPQRTLWETANGVKSNCRGWLAYYADNFNIDQMNNDFIKLHLKQPIYSITDPSGNVLDIIKLREFCRAQGLNHSSLLRMLRNPKIKHHKGWSNFTKHED